MKMIATIINIIINILASMFRTLVAKLMGT
jgi:hypothetical protein